jgi:DNA-binding MarR family transcriptional regulator
MPRERATEYPGGPPDGGPGDERASASSDVLAARLGYLFKQAQQRLAGLSARALGPFGVDGRELAVLVVLAARDPLSQLEAAGRLGVDRTTMVGLIDGLEAKGLVERRRSPHDRRKNIVPLTAAGRDCLERAEEARQETERRFLAPLGRQDADRLVRALQVLVAAPRDEDA